MKRRILSLGGGGQLVARDPAFLGCFASHSRVRRTLVRSPYGDGASFSGFRSKPWTVPGSNSTLTFRGIKNLDAALDWAFARSGLGDATDFVLTGGSAGGLSTFLHADRVAARVATGAPKAAGKIRAAPFTGFFLDHGNFQHSAANYTAKMEYIYNMQNLSFGADGGLTQVRSESELYPCLGLGRSCPGPAHD